MSAPLKSYIDRILNVLAEIDNLGGDKKEIYKELAGDGYDRTVVSQVVGHIRKKAAKPGKFAEQSALFDLYLTEYEGVGTVRANAHAAREFIDHDTTTGEVNPSEAAMLPQTAGSETAVANSTPGSGAGTVDAGEANWPSEMTTASPANEPETIPPVADPATVVSEAGDDRSTGTASATVVAFRINTKTHFANSKGLPRLHGCLKPEACGGSHRSLCFGCSVQHDGPAHQEGAA